MENKLLIVESPGKIKKIQEFLGDGWEVKASIGHICDLPLKELGIEKDNGFKLHYQVTDEKKDVVKNLSLAVNRVGKQNVYLATDPDREGEAISFHLCRNLGLNYKDAHRITFQEITKNAVLSAISKPRTIDLKLVSAQEARRAIDRLVGFEISPLLWRKIKSDSALSAGRVQSVAVKLVVEREKEISNFASHYYFRVSATFITPGQNKLKALATQTHAGANQARTFLEGLLSKSFTITSILKEPVRTLPQPPFSTSTLQQDANKKLNFSVSKTMQIAQKLYEAGHITYMRTDSVNLSQTAIDELSTFIVKTYGQQYLEVRKFKNKNEAAQEAHEAIRPSHFEHTSIDGTPDEKKLYNLIYLRAVASQMQSKRSEVTTITIHSTPGHDEFKAKASVVSFDGFTKAYGEDHDETDDQDGEQDTVEITEKLKEGAALKLESLAAKQSYAKPKSRYTEATLVKALEALGIGRPATYTQIMKTIKDTRKYIIEGDSPGNKFDALTILYENGRFTEKSGTITIGQAKSKLLPAPIAFDLIAFLESGFARIMDYTFTATCEDAFDKIAEGKGNYLSVVQNFYTELEKSMTTANQLHPDLQPRERKTIDVGEFEKKIIRAGKNERGVYIIHKDKFFAVPDILEPQDVTLAKAIATIQDARAGEKQHQAQQEANTINTFGKYKIIQGKFGPYITDGKINAQIPKWDLENISRFDESKCKEIVKAYKAYKRKQK